jgi:hypothetical protein
MTFIIGLLFLGIVASMGQALFAMTSGPDTSGRVVRALTLRVALSLLVFALMLVGAYFH